MNKIDKDEVQELRNLPSPCAGAPSPMIIACESTVWLAYFISESDPWFEEKYSQLWSDSDELCQEECLAIIRFQSPRCHMFGEPSLETITTHPLSKMGLKSLGIYEIGNSSWLKELDQIGSFAHSDQTTKAVVDKHYVFAFHDSTFECIAQDLRFFVRHGDMLEQVQMLIRELERGEDVPISLSKIS